MKRRERTHVQSLIDKLARAYMGRSIMRWSEPLTEQVDREIADIRERLLRQGVSPIELLALEVQLAEDAEKLEQIGSE